MYLEVKLIIGLVADLIISKWHISHGHIKEIILKIGLFISADTHICLRIKLLCDATCQIIKFHSIQFAVLHFLRQHTEEVSYTHSRFKDISLFKAHLPQCFIDISYDHGTCEMCVKGTLPSRIIFIRCQHTL